MIWHKWLMPGEQIPDRLAISEFLAESREVAAGTAWM
jgi:hypothetical protein